MKSSTNSSDVRIARSGITYQRRGVGTPVVLVHGWCLDRTVWLYQEQALIGLGYDVISLDLAGYGESRGLSGPFTMARHGADIVDLLDELDLRDATLVGFAYGAGVLLSMPSYERVSGVVSIGVPSATGAPYPKMRSAMLRDWPTFAQRSARAICADGQSEASLAWLGDVFGRTPLNTALAGVDVLAEFEPLALEPEGRTRLLFVHGSADMIVSPDVSRAAADHFADARFVLVEGAAHFVPWDKSAELSTVIADFVGGDGSGE